MPKGWGLPAVPGVYPPYSTTRIMLIAEPIVTARFFASAARAAGGRPHRHPRGKWRIDLCTRPAAAIEDRCDNLSRGRLRVARGEREDASGSALR